MPWVKSGINKFIPSVIIQPKPQIPQTMKLLSKNAIVVDIGAGSRKIADDILCIDQVVLPNIDIVADVHYLPLKSESIDCVFCTGVLEHIMNPDNALREIHRVLKSNGIVHLEVPFMQPYHRDPNDYWRWTLDGLRLFTQQHKFKEIRSGALIGPASAMNAIIIAYFQSWFRNKYIRKLIDLLLSFILFPFKNFDRILLNKNMDLLSAIYFVGRKIYYEP